MPHQYIDGTVSDASINSGARGTPAVREAAEATNRAAVEATRDNGRKVERAMVWLASTYLPTLTVGTGVAVTVVRTAGNAAGHQTADVNTALSNIAASLKPRATYDGTTVTRMI